ncbi:MAG TPA: DNA repair protein RadC [Steroidobacteraceae bacterium]|jgi:DNA repair protein RadC
MAIRDWPADDRPREKLLSKGPAILSDAELLAILLRQGRAGSSALDLARELLRRFESLRQLLNADERQVCAVAGMGPARYAELRAAAEISRRLASQSLRSGPMLATPRAVRDFLSARLRDLPHELFCCLFLDRRQRLVHFEELFRGTLDSASVHPREIVKLALQRNAASVIVAHNHPLCFVWIFARFFEPSPDLCSTTHPHSAQQFTKCPIASRLDLDAIDELGAVIIDEIL